MYFNKNTCTVKYHIMTTANSRPSHYYNPVTLEQPITTEHGDPLSIKTTYT